MTCTHHWLLESPSGPTVKGVCRTCGSEREFPASIPEGWLKKHRRKWNDDPLAS